MAWRMWRAVLAAQNEVKLLASSPAEMRIGAYLIAPDAISRETEGFSMDALEFVNDVES